MNIIDIQWHAYRLPFLHSFSTAHSVMTAREGISVQVTTHQGISGIGEIAPLPTFAGGSLADAFALLPTLAARLRHKTLHEALDLLTTEKATSKSAPTICGLEIALLDALGKTGGCSISTLLSPASFTPRTTVPVNAVISAGTTQAAITSAQQAKKSGFHCIKLKVGSPLSVPLRAQFIAPSTPPSANTMNPITTSNTIPGTTIGAQFIAPSNLPPANPIIPTKTSNTIPIPTVGAELSCPPPMYRPWKSTTSHHQYDKTGNDPHAEIERIAAVRDAIGPSMHLRLDANEAWNLEEAIAILSQCVPYDIQYVEQPLKAHDLAGMRALRQAIPIPIAVDEALHNVESARLVLANEAADILVLKPQLAGGLRAGQQIIQAATERGVRCVLTSALEAGIGLAAVLHLAAASPAVTLECGLATLHLLIDDLLIDDLSIRDGCMSVPAGPGLGVELDRQALERYTVGGLA